MLFSIKEKNEEPGSTELLKIPDEHSIAASAISDSEEVAYFGRGHQVIDRIIGTIQQNKTIHYATEGQWSAHDLLEHVLKITGPAKVYLTTWAMTENPVRTILNLVDAKLILELYCIFDLKIQGRAPQAFQLISGLTKNICMAHCHAKVTVIENDEWCVSINGSANYTKNPRLESGVISSNKTIGQFHREWIMKKIDGTK